MAVAMMTDLTQFMSAPVLIWAGIVLLGMYAIISSIRTQSPNGRSTSADKSSSPPAMTKASDPAPAAVRSLPQQKRKSRRQRQNMALAMAQGLKEDTPPEEKQLLPRALDSVDAENDSDHSSVESTEPPSDSLSETSGDQESLTDSLVVGSRPHQVFEGLESRTYDRCLLLACWAQQETRRHLQPREVLQWPPGLVPPGLHWSPYACAVLAE